MQSFAKTVLGRQSVALAQVQCRSPVVGGVVRGVWHGGNLTAQTGCRWELGGPHFAQDSGSGVGRDCYKSHGAQRAAALVLDGCSSSRKACICEPQLNQQIRLFRSRKSNVQRGGASCMLAVAQEGFSQAEGSLAESKEQEVTRKPTGDDGDEDESGVVIIGVRECNDGSVIFDFGSAEERPEQDPLNAFIYGTALVEGPPSGSPAATTTISEEQGHPEPPDEALRESDSIENEENNASSSSGELEIPVVQLHAGGALLPHPAKVKKGGEDAFFLARNDQSSYLGISDGVGGWAPLGIDAGLYSRELMYHCEQMTEENMLPRSMLIRAHKMTQATGSATVMVARLQGNNLRIANLGDSGFLLVRNGAVALASTQMQHAFNFPFQVGSKGGDDPECAKDYEIEVERGDLLVLGTDGLFDNLFEKDILEALVMLKSKGIQPQLASQHIATFAHKRSLSKTGLSPFAVQADAAGYKHVGGKPDDVTVVVAYLE